MSPLPSEPVAGATIATDWGVQIHGYTFAPAGAQVHSGAARAMGAGNPSTLLKLHLDVADEDPGGYLDAANDQLEVPTDGGGLYLVSVTFRTDNGADTDETNVRLRINGADTGFAQVGNEGATAVFGTILVATILAAGDIISVYARQIGSGSRADVDVIDCTVVRIGAEFGNPI